VYATNKYAKLGLYQIITANGTAIDRWVITELTTSRLVFKFQFDVDSDGELLKPSAAVMNLLWR
jgi:hypothetical protein